ncbi:unnamed protein product, partial [Discosporangium mesarthrocarpum]
MGEAPAASDRYCHLRSTLGEELLEKVHNAKVLVVGAGGIGCELLKNLVLTGFHNIEVIDLDTIDQSNLNRQFLFRPHHINKSKALMARESVLKFNPRVSLLAHHGNVKEARFGLRCLRQFDIVFNALDNVGARRHVNRLCLAAEKPLIESGTTGYLGQVQVISKGETECYDCKPKHTPKGHAICTIRSTPSKPVHCIIWAKQLFMLMFGKCEASMLYDRGEDEGEEGQGGEGGKVLNRPQEGSSPEEIASYCYGFMKALFRSEIIKQISMGTYKGAEKPPTPMDEGVIQAESMPSQVAMAPGKVGKRGWDRREWSVEESVREMCSCVQQVYQDEGLSDGGQQRQGLGLLFDKDDLLSMRFVAAASNLRSRIPAQSYYEAKGVAGNIIPAIATTNAIIAGLQVMEALKILRGSAPIVEECRYTYCLREPTRKGLFLQPTRLQKPSDGCHVCGTPIVELCVDTGRFTLKELIDKVLKGELGVEEPSVSVGTTIVYDEDD